MSMFSGIENAKTSTAGNYIRPGMHVLRIGELKATKSRRGEDLFIIDDAEIVSSIPGVDVAGNTVAEHRPGEFVSVVWNLTKHDAAIGNVKGFLAAVANCDPSEVDEAGALAAVSAQQPFRGTLVKVQAAETETKSGHPFTRLHFYHHATE